MCRLVVERDRERGKVIERKKEKENERKERAGERGEKRGGNGRGKRKKTEERDGDT